MVDPRMFGTFDLADSYAKGLQIRQAREQQQNQKRLGDLLPGAVNGDTSAMEQIAHINPELFMRLDERQKAQAAAELNDLAGAVRWADTPEKWQQVQQYYASHGHNEAMQYPFESRETVVMQLGKIGEYLKSAPKAENAPSSYDEYQRAQADPNYARFLEGRRGPIVANNGDGTFTLIPRNYQGGGQSAPPPPPPGFRLDEGGPSQGGSGGFPQ